METPCSNDSMLQMQVMAAMIGRTTLLRSWVEGVWAVRGAWSITAKLRRSTDAIGRVLIFRYPVMEGENGRSSAAFAFEA